MHNIGEKLKENKICNIICKTLTLEIAKKNNACETCEKRVYYTVIK